MLDVVCQIWIAAFGMAAIWLVGRKDPKQRKRGFVLGVISQPAWLLASALQAQWGIFAVSCWYTYAWVSGLVNNWRNDDLS